MRIAATPRIFIQTPDMLEAEMFVHWLNDPEVVQFSEQRHLKHTIESQRDYWTLNSPNVHAIYLSHTNIPIGSVSYQIDPCNKVANVGIMIGDKSVWGKGYGFEAWRATCNYLFYSGVARKVEAGCMLANAAMVTICEKYGMHPEGNKVDHFLLGDRKINMLMFGKLHP